MREPTDPISERGDLERLRSYGARRVVLSWDFLAAFALSLVLTSLSSRTCRLAFLAADICPQLAAIAGGFAAIVLGAVAILVSFADAGFLRVLRRTRIVGRLLFPYALTLYASIAALLSNLLTWGVAPRSDLGALPAPAWLSDSVFVGLCWLSLFTFLYAAFAIAALIPTTLDTAQMRSDLSLIEADRADKG
ncbi:MAG: hypothetical protein ACE149_02400 [Armatimonadota bacterium]